MSDRHKKRRIFIAMHYMEIGGAEISLIGLLQALDYSKYDVDLFIYSHQGELMQFIPKEVNLLPEISAYAYIERSMMDALQHGHLCLVMARLWARYKYQRYLRRSGLKASAAVFQYIGNAVTPILPSLHKYGEYDLAISFLTPHNIVLDKVKARRKACWIHTDYSTIDVNAALELPVWNGYNHIVSISHDVTNTFLGVFPLLRDKMVEIENILSPKFVRARAYEFDALSEMHRPGDDTTTMKLLSIGRFSEQKNFDNVPDICRRINAMLSAHQRQIRLRWYIIGFGADEALIRRKTCEAGMLEHVIILGKRSNPYPYIKACDIYVQPSRYEGKSVTVREAQMLCKPVVVTNYPTAKSQVQDGIDGVIVPMDNEGCARGIANLIIDSERQEQMTAYQSSYDYGNIGEAEKIKMLMK